MSAAGTPVNAAISVITAYDHERRQTLPRRFVWAGAIVELRDARPCGTSRVGRTVYVHYTAVTDRRRFALKLNIDSRAWTLVSATERA